MKTKIIALMLATVFATSLVFAGCSSSQKSSTATTAPAATTAATTTAADAQKVFTLEELAKFDGQNGNPAYVAYNGVVYDVTDIRQWRNGQHNGQTACIPETPNYVVVTNPAETLDFTGLNLYFD